MFIFRDISVPIPISDFGTFTPLGPSVIFIASYNRMPRRGKKYLWYPRRIQKKEGYIYLMTLVAERMICRNPALKFFPIFIKGVSKFNFFTNPLAKFIQ